jgi:hypothetical protein
VRVYWCVADRYGKPRMRESTAQLERNVGVAGDPRWDLVERIVASPCFVKSPRLCSFLIYICDLFLRGRADEINELNIGEALFDRPANYDPSADGIVRSHASRLRQRLDQYFSEEGAQEPIRLLIPKGGYTPVFEPRTLRGPDLEALSFPPQADPAAPQTDRNFRWIWILSVALALASVAIVYLLVHPVGGAPTQVVVIKHPLWGRLFGQDHPTIIVASDTGLTTLQALTGRKVSLADYLNGDYRTHVIAPAGTTADVINGLGARRYTSIVDLDIVTKLYQIPGISLGRTQVRYARDLRLNDLKSGPVILLGAQEGTPWVELFEHQMNFVLLHDRQRHSFVVTNRSPRGTELSRYEADMVDPQHKVYGLIALRPNLEGFGHILILEGTSMAGTESAADFVFDDTRLLPFLEQIKSGNGSLPYFELLLQSNSMNGSASQSEVVAYRTSAN